MTSEDFSQRLAFHKSAVVLIISGIHKDLK